jgi:dTDP-glucose 4,6-dehydratase
MRLLVTGGAGFIGSHFVHHWLSSHPGDRLVVLDALTYAGSLENLAGLSDHPDFRFVHGDIRDTPLVESLLQQERLDTLVHFAAESHVDRSIQGPDVFLETNVIGTHSLLKAARTVWLERQGGRGPFRFHHISTDEVFGPQAEGQPPVDEGAPYRPSSPYAASKAASDHLVQAYHTTYGLPVSMSHSSNTYGPRQWPEKLIPLSLECLLNGRDVPVYGDGLQRRDWLFVSDLCDALDAILMGDTIGNRFNIGGDQECTNRSLLEALCSVLEGAFDADLELARRFPRCPAARGIPCRTRLLEVPDRLGHDRLYALNCQRLRIELGVVPRVSLEEGLRRVVAARLRQEK